MRLARPARVLVRPVSSTYASCLRANAHVEVDVARAQREHAAYVMAIRDLGLPVEVVPAAEDCADACFLEDTAVITGAHALVTRPGAASRRPEVSAVATALRPFVNVHVMAAPASLDGGDVLRAGATLFVGLSSRTNPEGIAALAAVAAQDGLEVVTVPVDGALHLKSACTLVDGATLLYAPELLGERELDVFRARGLTCIAAEETVGANVLALGDDVLVSAAAPHTARSLATRGHRVRTLEVGEFHKGDGALTCLSLRIPSPGAACT